MSEIVVLPFAAEADVDRFRRALAALLEERSGDPSTHRVTVVRPGEPRVAAQASPDSERIVLVAVEASPEGLRNLWRAGLEHTGVASDARGFVIVRRAPTEFGEADPAYALPASLTHLFSRPRADPAWRLADASVSSALAAAADHPDHADRPVYALREADGLDAPTTREAAALEGHYRALVDRLFPVVRRRPVPMPATNAHIERRLRLLTSNGEPQPFDLGDDLGIIVLVAPSGAGKSVFVRDLAERRALPVISLSKVSAPEQLGRRLRDATVVDGRLRCLIDDFEASAGWLGHLKQAAFAQELVDALRDARETRGATAFDLVLALRPSEHVATLTGALRALGPVTPVTLAPLDSAQAHDFARTHVRDDAGVLLQRLDEIGLTAHREDLRFFRDLCSRWRDAPETFTADPVDVMGFGLDQRLAPSDTEENTRLTAPERRRIAASFAFAATLTDRLHLARNGAPPDPSCLTEADLFRLAGTAREELQDTLRAAPIFLRTSGSTGFQHESDREFLAAEHMAGLPSHLVERWMVVGKGEHARVPFSLRAVARWLLLQAPLERVDWLLSVEPTLVIEALPWLRPDLHASAVRALIEAHRSGRFPLWMAEQRLPDQFTLHGSEVHELLCRELTDPGDPFVRRFAARALGHAQDPGPAALLAARALETTETMDVRVAAAASVVRLGDVAAIRMLEPLLDLLPAEDPDLELRGIALLALWPQHIDARRFFGALGPWPKAAFFGAYAGLFWRSSDTLAGLRAADLPAALAWATEKLADPDVFWVGEFDRREVSSFAVELARRALALRAPNDFGAPWLELCARAIECGLVRTLRRPQDTKFWRAAARLHVSRLSDPDDIFPMLDTGVVDATDLDWVLEEAKAPGSLRQWVMLAVTLWHPQTRPELFDAIHALPGAVELAPYWFKPIALDSDEAQRARADLHRREPKPAAEAPTPPEPPPVRTILSMSFAQPDQRWLAVHQQALCRSEWRDLHCGSVDAFTLPGAPAVTSPEAQALLDAASEFIESAEPALARWSRERPKWNFDASAACALGTLAIHAPERLLALGPALLGAWAPLALGSSPPDDRGPWLRLLWAEAPAALRDALRQVAGDTMSGGSLRRALTELDRAAAIELALELLDTDTTADAVCCDLLFLLFDRGDALQARTWALAHLDRDGIELTLVRHDPEPVHLRQLLTTGRAEEAARLLARTHDRLGLRTGHLATLEKLSPAERAALVDALLAVARTLPVSGFIALSDITLRGLAQALLRGLVDAGEVAALTDLAKRHPELQPEAERARVQRAQLDWKPPTLESLIADLEPPNCSPERPATLSPQLDTKGAASMEYLFTWLHLSDLHFGQGGADYKDNRELVLGALRGSLADLGRPGGPPRPDVILVTGDIAFSGGGRADDYGKALTWFGTAAEAVGLGLGDVYAVPGNHDVDRDAGKSDPDVADTLAKYRGEAALGAIWGAHHENQLARLAARQQKYLDFAAQLAPGTADLFWRKRVPARRGLKVRLVGLNSSLLAADDQDAGRLEVGDRQRRMLLEPPPEPGEVLIALQHHPVGLPGPHWLKSHDASEHSNWLANHTAVALYGHVHDPEVHTVQGGGAEHSHYRLIAGAAHDEKSVPKRLVRHAYSVAAIALDGNGALHLEIWPRAWSPKNTDFRLDTDNVPKGKGSTLRPLDVAGWTPAVATSRRL